MTDENETHSEGVQSLSTAWFTETGPRELFMDQTDWCVYKASWDEKG